MNRVVNVPSQPVEKPKVAILAMKLGMKYMRIYPVHTIAVPIIRLFLLPRKSLRPEREKYTIGLMIKLKLDPLSLILILSPQIRSYFLTQEPNGQVM
jgi:hypothetical protein